MNIKLLTRFLISSFAIVLILSLTACAPRGKTSRSARDSAPKINPAHLDRVPDATPKFEPLSKSGNRYKKNNTYVEKKKRYKVMSTSRGYKEHGLASWYGTKFHGRKTSSGERYDMYAMTAAHRTLPLPTYARVTNLVNGKSIIVKVNDRGPFHKNRLIDLSYVAAHKLGMVGTGTTKVKVESVDPRDHGRFVHKKGGSIFSRLKNPRKETATSTGTAATALLPVAAATSSIPKNSRNSQSKSTSRAPKTDQTMQTRQIPKTENAAKTKQTLKKQNGSTSDEIYVPDDKIVKRATANSKTVAKAVPNAASTAASKVVSKVAPIAVSKAIPSPTAKRSNKTNSGAVNSRTANRGTVTSNIAEGQKSLTMKNGAKHRYYLQMGSFSQKSGAEKLVKKLELLSNVPSHIKESKSKNHPIFRVQIGPLYSQQDALRLSKKLKQPQMPAAVVISD